MFYSLFFFRFLTEPIYLMSFGIRMRKRNMFLNDIFFFTQQFYAIYFPRFAWRRRTKVIHGTLIQTVFFFSPYFGSHVTRTNTHCNGESFELTNAFQSMSKFILPVRWDECSPTPHPHKTPQAMNWNYIIYHLNWQRGGICIGLKLLNYVILN